MLVGHNPAGGLQFADGRPCFGRDFERRLEMGLDEKLLDSGERAFLFEIPKDLDQVIRYPHGQIGGESASQADSFDLRIFFSLRPSRIGSFLANRHFPDFVQQMLQSGILAHQRIPSGAENVFDLPVFFQESHQTSQFLVPALFGLSSTKLKLSRPF